jgi:hypothetical protein
VKKRSGVDELEHAAASICARPLCRKPARRDPHRCSTWEGLLDDFQGTGRGVGVVKSPRRTSTPFSDHSAAFSGERDRVRIM